MALGLACAGPGKGADSGEWVREYDGFMPETDLYEYDVIFVRDKRTGRPIEDARVTKHPED